MQASLYLYSGKRLCKKIGIHSPGDDGTAQIDALRLWMRLCYNRKLGETRAIEAFLNCTTVRFEWPQGVFNHLGM